MRIGDEYGRIRGHYRAAAAALGASSRHRARARAGQLVREFVAIRRASAGDISSSTWCNTNRPKVVSFRAKMDEVTLRLDDASAALQTAKVGESTRLQMPDEHLALARQTVELLERAT